MIQRHPVLKLAAMLGLTAVAAALGGALIVDVQRRGTSPNEIIERHVKETVESAVVVKDDPQPTPVPVRPYRVSGPTKAVAGSLVRLTADGAGASSLAWMLKGDDEFPTLTDDAVSLDNPAVVERGKYFTFAMPGGKAKQSFALISIVNGQLAVATWAVSLDGPAPDPEPTPDPKPPTPVPPQPQPTPGGPFGVLILEETADRGKNPQATEVLLSPVVREYMTKKCAKESDGKTPKWRIWDDDYTDEQVAASGGDWPAWFKRAKEDSKGTLPWIVISDGKTKGESMPLPQSVDAMLALLKKYGGE